MKDYGQIVSKIVGTPWMITDSGLRMILGIVESHMAGNMNLEEIRAKANGATRDRGAIPSKQGSVGVLPLHGPIFPKANMMTELSGATSMEQWQQDFRMLLQDDRVDAILMDIDSPGGSSFMLEEMASEIRAARDIKPIYSVANTMAASAAYYLASQASEMYASDSSMVGSIGTFMVHTDDSAFQESQGIKQTIIKEGRFKAAEATTLTDESHDYLQNLVKEANDLFIQSVAAGRGTTVEDVTQNFGEGGILSAKKALEVGMVDGIRTYDEVLSALLDGGGTVTQERSNGGGIGFSLRASVEQEKGHGEPGLGAGEPRREPPADEHIDDWKNNGGRLQRPPGIPELEESVMNREELLAMAAKLGITGADKLEDADLATKVSEAVDASLEMTADLREATQQANKRIEFAQAYPEQAEELRKLRETSQTNEATAFAHSLADFSITEGEGDAAKKIDFRLSTRAQEVVKDAHLKLGQGQLAPSDLKQLIEVVAQGGVQQGEVGSSRQPEFSNTDAAPSGNRVSDRKKFADVVASIMESDNLEQKAAMKVAAERFPDLATAYATN